MWNGRIQVLCDSLPLLQFLDSEKTLQIGLAWQFWKYSPFSIHYSNNFNSFLQVYSNKDDSLQTSVKAIPFCPFVL